MKMGEKKEYRLDEYREYKDGNWSPWRKLDGRLFDNDPSSTGIEIYPGERIYDEWQFGKINNKYAWLEIKKERAAFWKIVNMDDMHKPDHKDALDYYNARIEKMNQYISEIEKKIQQNDEKIPQEIPDTQVSPPPMTSNSFTSQIPLSEIQFDVAFSFPGERRDVVQQIVDKLKKAKRHSVFYDKDFPEDLAVIGMDLLLTDVYKKQSKLVCVFICKEYEEKRWCGLEWRAIREIIDEKKGDNIMLIRMDNTEIPGISKNDGYIDMREYAIDEIVGFIERRIAKQKNALDTAL